MRCMDVVFVGAASSRETIKRTDESIAAGCRSHSNQMQGCAVALVVATGEGEQETIIGAGRYVVIDETGQLRSAEVAFTIEEDYHRQGMARILLQHLASIAREKGLSCFEAEVLPENMGMLTVFSRSGLPMKTEHGGDAVHVTLSLTGKVF